MREHANPGRDDGCKFPTCNNGDDARHPARRAGVDANDFRMGMGRTQEHYMGHAWQFHVADIEPASLQQPLEVWPWHHLADIRVWLIQRRESFGMRGCAGHGLRPMRRRAVVSTASIMAW